MPRPWLLWVIIGTTTARQHGLRPPGREGADGPQHAHSIVQEIAENRQRHRNMSSGASGASSTGRGPDLEEREMNGWAQPLLPSKKWKILPANQIWREERLRSFSEDELEALSRERRAKGMRFFFGYSTGHSGTTSLSSAKSYHTDRNCLWGFETLAQGVRDWARSPTADSKEFVLRYFLPTITRQVLEANRTCYIDLGHHVIFNNIIPVLAKELGSALHVTRIRRSRLQTAHSFAEKRKKDGPCGSRCLYCMCPEEQHSCVAVTMPQWSSLSVYER